MDELTIANERELRIIAQNMGNLAKRCIEDELFICAQFYADAAAHFAGMLLESEAKHGRV